MLDIMSQRYGKAPSEWLKMDDVEFAFCWEVASRALVAERDRS